MTWVYFYDAKYKSQKIMRKSEKKCKICPMFLLQSTKTSIFAHCNFSKKCSFQD